MIESIEIAGVATYGEAPQTMPGLSKFNFIYGANGSGKTTISRVVADEAGYASCRVNWKAGTKMQAMVYNRDFVEKNFGPSSDLKGIFSLIKGLFDEVRDGSSNIKQIFVLTHNVYFHKEVTFSKFRRDGKAMTEETFWVVRKAGLLSSLEKHGANPVTTSYDLLWSELRTPNRSNLTIQNVLRRILENYFKILGGIDFETIWLMFEGQDRLTCRSLFSWVNDGSHFTHDDLYVAIDDTVVERYLDVFKKIFQVAGHEAHYQMMMGDTKAPLAVA